jgi:hypothetical protein
VLGMGTGCCRYAGDVYALLVVVELGPYLVGLTGCEGKRYFVVYVR